MSRIGKLPVEIPTGVQISVSDKNLVTVKGPKGELKRQVNPDITVSLEEGNVIVTRPTDQKRHKALHGLYRALINRMVEGVTTGFKTEQELVGVGYRANANGQLLELTLGFSHEIIMEIPSEVTLKTISEKGQNPKIIMECCDNELLGMVAAKIRSFRKPEPYKGKGIKFAGEILRRKAGKSGGKGKK
jgi:large subunit ribosomal protein L6